MLRGGRFRHRLLDEDFLRDQAPQAATSLQPFVHLWKEGILNDAEMTGAYLLVFNFLRRPQDFLGGLHNLPLPRARSSSEVSGTLVVDLLRNTLPSNLQNAKSLRPLETADEFLKTFCAHSWRSIPFSVQRSLASWQSGLYPLLLTTGIPTAEEVLQMQARGQRCVSMLLDEKQITTFVEEGRDVLGFIVHDLIHADHFFHDPRKAQAQILFCQKLLLVLELPVIQQMLAQDAVFKSEFHYLMSDMNSVPLHLLKTLKAVLLGFYKRQAGSDMKQSLPHKLEYEFEECYHLVLQKWHFSEQALFAARRLNTPDFLHPEDSELLDRALGKNHSPTENYLVFS